MPPYLQWNDAHTLIWPQLRYLAFRITTVTTILLFVAIVPYEIAYSIVLEYNAEEIAEHVQNASILALAVRMAIVKHYIWCLAILLYCLSAAILIFCFRKTTFLRPFSKHKPEIY